jgi:hypothetical protein
MRLMIHHDTRASCLQSQSLRKNREEISSRNGSKLLRSLIIMIVPNASISGVNFSPAAGREVLTAAEYKSNGMKAA